MWGIHHILAKVSFYLKKFVMCSTVSVSLLHIFVIATLKLNLAMKKQACIVFIGLQILPEKACSLQMFE
jgi:hypothetical protein